MGGEPALRKDQDWEPSTPGFESGTCPFIDILHLNELLRLSFLYDSKKVLIEKRDLLFSSFGKW